MFPLSLHSLWAVCIILSIFISKASSRPTINSDQSIDLLQDYAIISARDNIVNTSTAAGATTAYFPTRVQGPATALAVFSVVLVIVTYLILIKFADYLVNTTKIPFEPLKKNIASILEATWPDNTSDNESVSRLKCKRNAPAILRWKN